MYSSATITPPPQSTESQAVTVPLFFLLGLTWFTKTVSGKFVAIWATALLNGYAAFSANDFIVHPFSPKRLA
jgi:hypothetical protein